MRAPFLFATFCSLIAVSHAASWDLAGDFSASGNPNGPWSYGAVVSNSFVPFDTVSSNSNDILWTYGGNTTSQAFIYQNNTAESAYGVAPGMVSLESDWGTPDARFTAPTTGLYNIYVAIGGTTAWQSNPVFGDGFGNNNADLASLAIGGVTQSGSFNNNVMTFNLSNVSLTAGTNIDAIVGHSYIGGNTQTIFTVSQAVPEPQAFAVFGIGAIGFVLRRKRKA